MAAPAFVEGDNWSYRVTVQGHGRWSQRVEQLTVTRLQSDAIAVDAHQQDSPAPPVDQLFGRDWSRTRSVDGVDTIVSRPLKFPLAVGRGWIVDFTEHNPTRQHLSERYRNPFRVVGWEDITVPAGSFHALKIESDGDWTVVTAPGVSSFGGTHADAMGSSSVAQAVRVPSRTASGHSYKAFWYVPGVKRWVKAEEDFYSSDGVRNASYDQELVSWHVSG